jgi:hypothetical protein
MKALSITVDTKKDIRAILLFWVIFSILAPSRGAAVTVSTVAELTDAVSAANVTGARQQWFVDTAGGDLHLVAAISTVVDRGVTIAGLQDDIDGDPRPMGRGVDIGADEWQPKSRITTCLTWLNLLLGD